MKTKIQELKQWPKLYKLACGYTSSHRVANNLEIYQCFNFNATSQGIKFWTYISEGDFKKAEMTYSDDFYFEIGKWYINTHGDFLKLKGINVDGSFVSSEKIQNDNYKKVTSTYSTSYGIAIKANYRRLKEKEISDLRDILPRGHSEKISNKSLFEIGKWYKFNECWYAKMSGEWKHSERINTKGIFLKGTGIINHYNSDKANTRFKKLTDLSEIQEFLPENHPDKMTKKLLFEKGKWYKNLGAFNSIAKFHHLNGDKFYHTDYLSQGIKFGTSNGLNYYGINDNTKLIDISEIIHLLPENHPDKMTKRDTKILAEDLENGQYYYTEFGSKYYKTNQKGKHIFKYLSGNIARVKCYDLTVENGNIKKNVRNFSHPRYKENLRCATKSEIERFNEAFNERFKKAYTEKYHEKSAQPIKNSNYTPKVGDWVVITKTSKNWGDKMDQFDGKSVKITSVYGKYNIRFNGSGSWQFNYKQGHFRPALESEISDTEKSESEKKTYFDIESKSFDELRNKSARILPVQPMDPPNTQNMIYYMNYVNREISDISGIPKEFFGNQNEEDFKRIKIFKPKSKIEIKSKSVKQVKFRKIKKL